MHLLSLCSVCSRPKGRDSRDLSSSSDGLQNDGKHQLDKTIQMREDLENEVNQIKDKISGKEQHIADLQKKAQVIYVMIFKGFCCLHLHQTRG
ncbi:RNA-binding (RRM/RBD/RNP motifs) family protein [Zea mays]|uniref:RNA-binding (RRM/RBD/RNP motifs) family protein n=1 Tax=Zea mays TaxID=4577 RepID=A0A1D6H7I8_MAIZE|nr:RNA-binding (RRM/RBD/RNP motifs) family protein [Zea mays]